MTVPPSPTAMHKLISARYLSEKLAAYGIESHARTSQSRTLDRGRENP